jgi:hypothetical protein
MHGTWRARCNHGDCSIPISSDLTTSSDDTVGHDTATIKTEEQETNPSNTIVTNDRGNMDDVHDLNPPFATQT